MLLLKNLAYKELSFLALVRFKIYQNLIEAML